jgi:predicted RNA-binding Zn-ribbon protein involved in translation (DUF1610 family)
MNNVERSKLAEEAQKIKEVMGEAQKALGKLHQGIDQIEKGRIELKTEGVDLGGRRIIKKQVKSLKFLDDLLIGELTQIEPVFDFECSVGFRYPKVEEILEFHDEETIRNLETFVKQGYLKKKFYDKMLLCPKCGSFKLRPSTVCPHCGSSNILKSNMLEHFSCGYIGPEEDFANQDDYECPKCNKKLRIIGSDYQRLGSLYDCKECGKRSKDPQVGITCIKCSNISTIEELKEKQIFSYQITDDKEKIVNSFLKPKNDLVEFLSNKGYDVITPAVLKGKSTVDHEVDIYAEQNGGKLGNRLIFRLCINAIEVQSDEVLKLYGKGHDLNIMEMFMFAIPKLSHEAKLLAKFYGMRFNEAETLEKAVQLFIHDPKIS